MTHKIRKLNILVLILTFFLLTPAFANEDIENVYILIEGPHAGLRLIGTSPFGDFTALPQVNDPEVGAVGRVAATEVPVTPAMGCDGFHYHGTLFNEDDPNPTHCGWGRVVIVKDETVLSLFSVAIDSEERAIPIIKEEAKEEGLTFSRSLELIGKSKTLSLTVIKAKLQSKNIDKKVEDDVKKLLNCVVNHDFKAERELLNISRGQKSPDRELAARIRLERALKCKRRGMDILKKKNLLEIPKEFSEEEPESR